MLPYPLHNITILSGQYVAVYSISESVPFTPTVNFQGNDIDVLPPVMTFYRHLVFSGKSPEAFFGSKYKGYCVTSHSVTIKGVNPN